MADGRFDEDVLGCSVQTEPMSRMDSEDCIEMDANVSFERDQDTQRTINQIRAEAMRTLSEQSFRQLSFEDCRESLHMGADVNLWQLDMKSPLKSRRPHSNSIRVDSSDSVLVISQGIHPEDGKNFVVSIDQICDIRLQINTDFDTVDLNIVKNERDGLNRFFSIVIRTGHASDLTQIKIINIMTVCSAARQKWVKGLTELVEQNRINAPFKHGLLRRLQTLHATVVNKGSSKKLHSRDVERTLGLQGLEAMGRAFSKRSNLTPDKLRLADFQSNIEKTILCSHLRQVYDSYATRTRGGGMFFRKKVMSISDITKFLVEQNSDIRTTQPLSQSVFRQRAAAIIRDYEPTTSLKDHDMLSFTGFRNYIFSPKGGIINPSFYDVHEDLSLPLNKYFISSSHNTYLIGKQLMGKCDVEIYRQVLLEGCRCVELDVWNGPNGQPKITHGWSACVNSVSFRQVIEAIQECAFKTSDLPVILSLENHCKEEQRDRMAEDLEEVFGEQLLSNYLEEDLALGCVHQLPTPLQLRNRILIKNKVIKASHRSECRSDSSAFEALSRIDEDDEYQHQPVYASPIPLSENSFELHETSLDDNVFDARSTSVNKRSQSSSEFVDKNHPQQHHEHVADDGDNDDVFVDSSRGKIYEPLPCVVRSDSSESYDKLSRLVSYIKPRKFRGFQDLAHFTVTNMFSLSENRGLKYLRHQPKAMLECSRHHILRIYPQGKRITSTNYNPFLFWSAGAQMVALNWQTRDPYMQFYEAFFKMNGRSGFVTKPQMIAEASPRYDPFAKSITDVVTISLKLTFFSLHHMGASDIKLNIALMGIYSDCQDYSTRFTKTFDGISSLTWQSPETITFETIHFPDLAAIHISAFTKAKKCVGAFAVPLRALRVGYRTAFFQDASTPLASMLLRVEIDEAHDNIHGKMASMLENPMAHASDRVLKLIKAMSVEEGFGADDEADNEFAHELEKMQDMEREMSDDDDVDEDEEEQQTIQYLQGKLAEERKRLGSAETGDDVRNNVKEGTSMETIHEGEVPQLNNSSKQEHAESSVLGSNNRTLTSTMTSNQSAPHEYAEVDDAVISESSESSTPFLRMATTTSVRAYPDDDDIMLSQPDSNVHDYTSVEGPVTPDEYKTHYASVTGPVTPDDNDVKSAFAPKPWHSQTKSQEHFTFDAADDAFNEKDEEFMLTDISRASVEGQTHYEPASDEQLSSRHGDEGTEDVDPTESSQFADKSRPTRHSHRHLSGAHGTVALSRGIAIDKGSRRSSIASIHDNDHHDLQDKSSHPIKALIAEHVSEDVAENEVDELGESWVEVTKQDLSPTTSTLSNGNQHMNGSSQLNPMLEQEEGRESTPSNSPQLQDKPNNNQTMRASNRSKKTASNPLYEVPDEALVAAVNSKQSTQTQPPLPPPRQKGFNYVFHVVVLESQLSHKLGIKDKGAVLAIAQDSIQILPNSPNSSQVSKKKKKLEIELSRITHFGHFRKAVSIELMIHNHHAVLSVASTDAQRLFKCLQRVIELKRNDSAQ